MENLPWVLARFSAWIINSVVAAVAAKRLIARKRDLRLQIGTAKLEWSSSEKFADTE